MTNPIQAIIWQELELCLLYLPLMHQPIRMARLCGTWPIPWLSGHATSVAQLYGLPPGCFIGGRGCRP